MEKTCGPAGDIAILFGNRIKKTNIVVEMKEFVCENCGNSMIENESCISVGCSQCGHYLKKYYLIKGTKYVDEETKKSIWVFRQ